MDKGLNQDYENGIRTLDNIIQDWKVGKLDNRDCYMKIFKEMKRTDRMISRRYDNKGGSRWVEIMADQLAGKVITTDDLNEFNEEVRETIIKWSGIIG